MIVRERVSLQEQMGYVLNRVRAGAVSFFALCETFDRIAIIVTFLAILELIRRNRIMVEQETTFGDIRLRPVEAARAT